MSDKLEALLASAKPRKVRTAAGAKRFKQPIGTIIVPGGKALKIGDKGYDAADRKLSIDPRKVSTSQTKARIAVKSPSPHGDNKKSFYETVPVDPKDVDSWSDQELIDNYIAVSHLVDTDSSLPNSKYGVALDNLAALRKQLLKRDFDPKTTKKKRAEEIQDRAEALGTATPSVHKPVKKFREDTPEQRAADAQYEQTRKELDAREYLTYFTPLTASERRMKVSPSLHPLSDFDKHRKHLLGRTESPEISSRTEPERVEPGRLTWEMLPQIADYADSIYSEKYAEDIKYYLSTPGSRQIRSKLSSGDVPDDFTGKAEKAIKALDHITDMDLPENTLLFRGMAVPLDSPIDNLKPGDSFTDPSFVSTSIKESEAIFFAKIKEEEDILPQKVIFEIETRPGLKGAPLYAIGYDGLETADLWNKAFGDEHEVLLKRNVTFDVADVSMRGTMKIIKIVPTAQKDTTITSK